ncbi:hypothetical protein, partial [Streptomyces phytophilus]|uniref:hypothetical protein n=1 Tax=Streptomyces phytophilus TaxID=722715 RepID=UPI00215D9632
MDAQPARSRKEPSSAAVAYRRARVTVRRRYGPGVRDAVRPSRPRIADVPSVRLDATTALPFAADLTRDLTAALAVLRRALRPVPGPILAAGTRRLAGRPR